MPARARLYGLLWDCVLWRLEKAESLVTLFGAIVLSACTEH